MSESQHWVTLVRCDHGDGTCGVFHRAMDRDRLIEMLRAWGWAFQEGMHYCPDHVSANIKAGGQG